MWPVVGLAVAPCEVAVLSEEEAGVPVAWALGAWAPVLGGILWGIQEPVLSKSSEKLGVNGRDDDIH